MTDLTQKLVVILDKPMPVENAQKIISAIIMIKHVVVVKPEIIPARFFKGEK